MSGATGDSEPQAKDFYQRLIEAHGSGDAPDFSIGTPMTWVKAIDELLTHGQVEVARSALDRLRQREPDLQWTENMLELISLLPAEANEAPRFIDDPENDVQLVRRPGAKTLIFVFCGRMHRIGMPTWMFQRWMSRLDANVVYLRDFSNMHFLGGVRSWGSRERTIISLNWIAEQLRVERVVCIGNSAGGYAAMFYALEIGASGVLNLSGGSNLELDFNTFLNRIDVAKELKQAFPELGLDLRARYQAAARRPQAIVVYGEQAWDDRIQCEHMAGVPDVELMPLSGFGGHGTLPELVRRGLFAPVLDRLVGAAEPATAEMAETDL